MIMFSITGPFLKIDTVKDSRECGIIMFCYAQVLSGRGAFSCGRVMTKTGRKQPDCRFV
jgi:hypothetical protein